MFRLKTSIKVLIWQVDALLITGCIAKLLNVLRLTAQTLTSTAYPILQNTNLKPVW